MSRYQLIVALGVSAVLAIGGPASAAGLVSNEPASIIVRTDDVNLHTAAGARQMALRIHNAAAAVCDTEGYPVAVRISDGFIRCREAAVEHAVRDLNAPMVANALDHSRQMLSRGD
jgi:UrcA family protein